MKSDNLLLAGAVLAGVSVTTGADAASMTVDSSFVNDFDGVSSQFETFEFAPFMGDAGDLTGVIMELDSFLVTGQPFPTTVLFISMIGEGIVAGTDANSTTTEFNFQIDLLGLGFDPNSFVGGPVEFFAAIDVEEAVSTGIWYAGEDPSGGGGGGGLTGPQNFGSVTLTYEYADPPAVPLPGSLALAGMGIAAFGVARRRRESRQ